MTVAEFKASAGLVDDRLVTLRDRAGLIEISWPDAMCGERGWWWGVAQGSDVITFGWTSGGSRDRNVELARAVADFRARRAA